MELKITKNVPQSMINELLHFKHLSENTFLAILQSGLICEISSKSVLNAAQIEIPETISVLKVGRYRLKKSYILVQVNTKLYVIANSFGFHVARSFDNVDKFVILDRRKTYKPDLVVFNVDGSSTVVNAQSLNEPEEEGCAKAADLNKVIGQSLSDHVLQVAVTKEMFLRVKSQQLFGSNLVRRELLEEKMFANARIADVWWKWSWDTLSVFIPFMYDFSRTVSTLRNERILAVSDGISQYKYDYHICRLQPDSLNRRLLSRSDNIPLGAACIAVINFKSDNQLVFDADEQKLSFSMSFDNEDSKSNTFLKDIILDFPKAPNEPAKNIVHDILSLISSQYHVLLEISFSQPFIEESFYKALLDIGFSEISLADFDLEHLHERTFLYARNDIDQWQNLLLSCVNGGSKSLQLHIYYKSKRSIALLLKFLKQNHNLKVIEARIVIPFDAADFKMKMIKEIDHELKRQRRSEQSFEDKLVAYEYELRTDFCRQNLTFL